VTGARPRSNVAGDHLAVADESATAERYAKYCPPLAVSVEPVIRPASSETRNTTQRAISSG